ncbi:hypothetical protein BC828DRAFT_386326 [Blastocladiella britannica]|nr:hypothetical protein BC828DRAFT_386326 [Blastocladiella britannica]
MNTANTTAAKAHREHSEALLSSFTTETTTTDTIRPSMASYPSISSTPQRNDDGDDEGMYVSLAETGGILSSSSLIRDPDPYLVTLGSSASASSAPIMATTSPLSPTAPAVYSAPPPSVPAPSPLRMAVVAATVASAPPQPRMAQVVSAAVVASRRPVPHGTAASDIGVHAMRQQAASPSIYSTSSAPTPTSPSMAAQSMPPPPPQEQQQYASSMASMSAATLIYRPPMPQSPAADSMDSRQQQQQQQQQQGPVTPPKVETPQAPDLPKWTEKLPTWLRSRLPRTRAGQIALLVVLILLIVLVVVGIWVLTLVLGFTTPDIQFVRVQLPNSSSVPARQPLAVNVAAASATINWDVVLSVSNANSIPIELYDVKYAAYGSPTDAPTDTRTAAAGGSSSLATGSLTNVSLPAANSDTNAPGTTELSLPLSFLWKVRDPGSNGFILNLLAACKAPVSLLPGVDPKADHSQVRLWVTADAGVQRLKLFGTHFQHAQWANFTCPVDVGNVAGQVAGSVLQTISGAISKVVPS